MKDRIVRVLVASLAVWVLATAWAWFGGAAGRP